METVAVSQTQTASSVNSTILKNATPAVERFIPPESKGIIPVSAFAAAVLDKYKGEIFKIALTNPTVVKKHFNTLIAMLNPTSWDAVFDSVQWHDESIRAILDARFLEALAESGCQVGDSKEKVIRFLKELEETNIPKTDMGPAEISIRIHNLLASTKERSADELATILWPDRPNDGWRSFVTESDWELCKRAFFALPKITRSSTDAGATLDGNDIFFVGAILLNIASRCGSSSELFIKAFLPFARMLEGQIFPPEVTNKFRRLDAQLAIEPEPAAPPETTALSLKALLKQGNLEKMLSYASSKLMDKFGGNIITTITTSGTAITFIDKFVKIFDRGNSFSARKLIGQGVRSAFSIGESGGMTGFITKIFDGIAMPDSLTPEMKTALGNLFTIDLPELLFSLEILPQNEAKLLGAIASLAVAEFLPPESKAGDKFEEIIMGLANTEVTMANGKKTTMVDPAAAVALTKEMLRPLTAITRSDYIETEIAAEISGKRTTHARLKAEYDTLMAQSGKLQHPRGSIQQAQVDVENLKRATDSAFSILKGAQTIANSVKKLNGIKEIKKGVDGISDKLYDSIKSLLSKKNTVLESSNVLKIESKGRIKAISMNDVLTEVFGKTNDITNIPKAMVECEFIIKGDASREEKELAMLKLEVAKAWIETLDKTDQATITGLVDNAKNLQQLNATLSARKTRAAELETAMEPFIAPKTFFGKRRDFRFDEDRIKREAEEQFAPIAAALAKTTKLFISPFLDAVTESVGGVTLLAVGQKTFSKMKDNIWSDNGEEPTKLEEISLPEWFANATNGDPELRGGEAMFSSNVVISGFFRNQLRVLGPDGKVDSVATSTLNDPSSRISVHPASMLVVDTRTEEEIKNKAVPKMKALFLTDSEKENVKKLIADGNLSNCHLFDADGNPEGVKAPWQDLQGGGEAVTLDAKSQEILADCRRVHQAATQVAKNAAIQMRIYNGEGTQEELEQVIGNVPPGSRESCITLAQTIMKEKTGQDGTINWIELRSRLTEPAARRAAA
ncbi:MAG: hypothetical protein LBB14_01785 [Puniceicoccales bacterium]|nr:hypothetical protein [Puniceicoccales bacterium]